MSSNKQSQKKTEALRGLNFSTASGRLLKLLLFDFVFKSGKNFCFQCEGIIRTVKEFSIEHKTPWMICDDPYEAYFDLNNIAYSHLSCNSKAARKTNKTGLTRREYNTKWMKDKRAEVSLAKLVNAQDLKSCS